MLIPHSQDGSSFSPPVGDSVENIFDQAKFQEADASTLVEDAIINGSILGVGSRATVYSIPGNPCYVLRIVEPPALGGDAALLELRKRTTELLWIDDPFNGHNFGQRVATLGDGIDLHIKQDGVPVGAPFGEWRHSAPLRIEQELHERYREQLSALSVLPQSAFNNFVASVEFLDRQNISIDAFNPNNILIDRQTAALNIVDLPATKLGNNSLSDLVHLLFDSHFLLTEIAVSLFPSKLSVFDPNQIRERRIVLRHLLLAMANSTLPVTPECTLMIRNVQGSFDDRWKDYVTDNGRFLETHLNFGFYAAGLVGEWPGVRATMVNVRDGSLPVKVLEELMDELCGASD